MDELMMTDAHGVEVFTRWWPIDDPRAVVLVAHGASEHSLRYDRYALALNAAGYAVAGIDHRGHGRTGASTGAGVMGPGGGMAVVDDLHQLRGLAVERFGAVPMFVFGHSMGSLIGLAYLVHHSAGLAGGVLCGFAANIDDTSALAGMLQAVAEAGMRDMPASDVLDANNAAFEPARTKYDWLSRDEAEVDKYVADPLCGAGNPLTFGYLIDLFEVVAPAGEHLGDITCPVDVIAGSQDPAAGMGAFASGLAASLAAAGVDASCTVYEGARHELLNETNRDEVTADLVGWLDAHV